MNGMATRAFRFFFLTASVSGVLLAVVAAWAGWTDAAMVARLLPFC